MRKRPKSSRPGRGAAAAGGEYRGPLAEPIHVPTRLASEAEWDQWNATLETKMHLLMQHFGIDPADLGAWARLSCELAQRHVPGFMPPPKKQGRPPARNQDDITLWYLFDLLKRRDGMTGRPASEVIAKAGAMRGTPGTLRTRHTRWRRKWPTFTEFNRRLVQCIGERNYIACLEDAVGDLLHRK
jgi:hypothetical protein